MFAKTNSVFQFLLEEVNKPPPKQSPPKMGDPNNLVRRSNSKQSKGGQECPPVLPFNRVASGQG